MTRGRAKATPFRTGVKGKGTRGTTGGLEKS